MSVSRESQFNSHLLIRNFSCSVLRGKRTVVYTGYGQPLGFDTKYLALADRNMQVRFTRFEDGRVTSVLCLVCFSAGQTLVEI